MSPKLIFPRPYGMHLIVQRSGLTLTVQLLGAGDMVLARTAGDVRSAYVMPDGGDSHALTIGLRETEGITSSFDVTSREAAVIRDQLQIGKRPLGAGTSFECSPIRAIAQAQGEALAAGAALERAA